MKIKLLMVCCLLSIHLSADLLSEGADASQKGDLNKALTLWGKACTEGSAKACDKQGSMYYFGYGVKQDQIKAKDLYLKACDSGVAEDCAKVAKMYHYGYTVKEDKAKALDFYKKACDLGDGESCKNRDQLLRSVN